MTNNARFTTENHQAPCAYSQGAAASIGCATPEKMAAILQPPAFYTFRRSLSSYAKYSKQIKQIGPNNTYNFKETQVSLIADIDAVCREIASTKQIRSFVHKSKKCRGRTLSVCSPNISSHQPHLTTLPLIRSLSRLRLQWNQKELHKKRTWNSTNS